MAALLGSAGNDDTRRHLRYVGKRWLYLVDIVCRSKGCALQKRAYHIRLFVSGASHVVRLTIDAPEVNNPKGFCGVAAYGFANRGHAYKALESSNELHCISRSFNRIPARCSTKSKNLGCPMLEVVHGVLLLPPLSF